MKLNSVSHCVEVDGQEPIHLTGREFDVLDRLVQVSGHVVTIEQLTHEIWGPQHFGSEHNLRLTVRYLRGKLGNDAVLTHHGHGYETNITYTDHPSITPEVRRVLIEALEHIEELEEAWRKGVINELDYKGGTRSNRNLAVRVALRKLLPYGSKE